MLQMVVIVDREVNIRCRGQRSQGMAAAVVCCRFDPVGRGGRFSRCGEGAIDQVQLTRTNTTQDLYGVIENLDSAVSEEERRMREKKTCWIMRMKEIYWRRHSSCLITLLQFMGFRRGIGQVRAPALTRLGCWAILPPEKSRTM